MKKSHFLMLSSACLIVLGTGFLAGCSQKANNTEAQSLAPQKYPVMVAKKGEVTFYPEFSATMKGISVVDIVPQVSGTITDIYMVEGQPVKKGQLLFIINKVQYQAAYEKALAAVASAEANLNTAKLTRDSRAALVQQKAVSKYDAQSSQYSYDAAVAALNEAKANLKKAKEDLDNTEVRSPVDGVCGMTNTRVGALVNANSTNLVTVSDNSQIYAYFSISEDAYLKFARYYKGSGSSALSEMPKVKLRLVDGLTYDEEGRIDAISGIVDSTTGAITCRAVFDNPNRLLASGGSGTIIIPVEIEDQIVIPQTATYELQDKTFVYKVGDDGAATAYAISIDEINDGQQYVVDSGMEQGDIYISDGAGIVRPGTPIMVPDEIKKEALSLKAEDNLSGNNSGQSGVSATPQTVSDIGSNSNKNVDVSENSSKNAQ